MHNKHYGRIHAWDRGTTLLAHGQLRGDVDSGKNGIPKGNVQNRMMEVREVTLEMVPSETDERVPPLALRETSLRIYPVETVLVAMYGGFNRIGRTGLLIGSSTVNRGQAAHSASSSHRGFLPRHLGSSAGGTGKVNNSSSDQR